MPLIHLAHVIHFWHFSHKTVRISANFNSLFQIIQKRATEEEKQKIVLMNKINTKERVPTN